MTKLYNIEKVTQLDPLEVISIQTVAIKSMTMIVQSFNEKRPLSLKEYNYVYALFFDLYNVIGGISKTRNLPVKDKDWPKIAEGQEWKVMYNYVRKHCLEKFPLFIKELQECVDALTLYRTLGYELNNCEVDYAIGILIEFRNEMEIQELGAPEFIYNFSKKK